MIPEHYRRMLPPQWYENELAEYHFEGTGAAVDAFGTQREDLLQQFSPWSATWGLDVWDWIYFGSKQLLSIEERRKNIQRKHWARLPFTLPVLKAMGQVAGKLEKVTEDFSNMEIVFEFSTEQPVNFIGLAKDFESIRPVHVNSSRVLVNSRGESILLLAETRFGEVEYPICGTFYPEDDMEGRIYRETVKITDDARFHPMDYPLTNILYPEQEV